jgi:hypothetical protein
MTYLRITDGTTTVNLIWHSVANPFFLLTRGDWAPSVPALRTSALALGGPYADVQEEIGVNVYGQTAVDCLANLDTLARLLDQADRWNPARGENVSAVRLQYGATGGAVIWESVITGRASGDQTSGVRLPPTFNQGLGAFVIENVRLKFWRRGPLLNPIGEAVASSSAANPTVQTCTFGNAVTISSPVALSYQYLNGGTPTNALTAAPVVLTASAANRLQIYEAEAGSLGSAMTSQADAAGKARGGNVARYAPGSLSNSYSFSLSGFDSAARRIAVWAAVRNSSATTTFTLQLGCAGASGSASTVNARPVLIDTSTTNPRIVCLGRQSLREAFGSISLALTASAASGNLDIDYLVVQAIDNETSGAVIITGPSTSPGENSLIIEPKALSEPAPSVASLSGIRPLSRSGDAFLMTRGATCVATILATSGTFWRAVDASNNLLNTIVTATRYAAALTPR